MPDDLSNMELPPRSHLPPWIVIEEVPGLGTTWYERGTRYWLRRAGLVLFVMALAAFTGFLTTVVTRSAGPPGSTRSVVVVTAVAAYTVATFVLTLALLPRNARRRAVTPNLPASATKGPSHPGRTGAGLGMAAQAGNAVAGAAIGIGAVLTLGFWVAGLILLLFPKLPAERAARRRLADLVRRHR